MTITGLTHGGRNASQVLASARELVGPVLRAAVDALADPVRLVAGYHLGWLDRDGRPTECGGKAFRPALVLSAAEAVGGRAREAVPGAVAVALVHNFSLLHDDVMDGDVERRHRPTAWAVFGIPAAVLAGDALWALALEALSGVGPTAGEGMRMLVTALRGLVDGQNADLGFERRQRVGLPECEAMAAGKTGALLGCACALGALYGGGTPGQVECLRRFGERIGLAFQLADDLLGIWGDPRMTGKPAGSDLRSRKKSLPVVAALTSGTPAGADLARLYQRDGAGDTHAIARMAGLVEQAGGRAWAQAEADRQSTAALACLEQAMPDPQAGADLIVLARLVARREC